MTRRGDEGGNAFKESCKVMSGIIIHQMKRISKQNLFLQFVCLSVGLPVAFTSYYYDAFFHLWLGLQLKLRTKKISETKTTCPEI